MNKLSEEAKIAYFQATAIRKKLHFDLLAELFCVSF